MIRLEFSHSIMKIAELGQHEQPVSYGSFKI